MEPLDTLLFRDGRPFGASSRALSELPSPQTVTGALRTWLLNEAGCDFAALGDEMRGGLSFAGAIARQDGVARLVGQATFRGPWFTKGGSLFFPVPATLRCCEEEDLVFRLDPLHPDCELPGWSESNPYDVRPLWTSNPHAGKRVTGFLSSAGMQTFLDGGVPRMDDIVPAYEFYGFDHRVGLGINPETVTVEPSLLYSASMLALQPDVSLYVEMQGPAEVTALLPDLSVPLALGGEGRRVAFKKLVAPGRLPAVAQCSDADGILAVLSAPAPFQSGWQPPALAPLAAAVPGYRPISGWNLALAAPKPTRFAVDSGAVYFLEKQVALPEHALCDGEDAAIGWGSFLTGAWNYVHI